MAAIHACSKQKVQFRISCKSLPRNFTSSKSFRNHKVAPAASAEESPPLHPVLSHARQRDTREHLQFDQKHLWHPYTSLIDPPPVLPVARAHGCTLVLEDGRQVLDGMSSWWAAIWGYNHPQLNAAMEHQMNAMSHVMFGGLTHRPATELASMLVHLLRNPQTTSDDSLLEKIFLTDSGSVAVEVALKMALQYHRGVQSHNRKTRILSVRGGYHGDTLGAMSVCDPINGMHTAFSGAMPQHVTFVTRPPCDGEYRVGNFRSGCQDCSCREVGEEAALKQAIHDLETVFQQEHEVTAALILEPLVQGAGGMRFYSPQYLRRARELCTEYGVLLICDEIATGFGRSGFTNSRNTGTTASVFASMEAGVQPDIICMGKALTGGYMTLGAVATTEKVAHGVSSTPSSEHHTIIPLPLMHGPTFMGNPLACAVAVASTNLMMAESNSEESDSAATTSLVSNITRIEQILRSNLEDASSIERVADIRVRGAIGVIELEEPLDMNAVPTRCAELGVWLRPFGNLLYTMPPFVMSDDELRNVTDAMLQLASDEGSLAKL